MGCEPWEVDESERQTNTIIDLEILSNLRDILINNGANDDTVAIYIGNYMKEEEADKVFDSLELQKTTRDSFIFDLEEAESRKILIRSIGSSGRGTYLPQCADVDIDIQIQHPDIADYKQLICTAIKNGVPDLNANGRSGTDFDSEPRISYKYKNTRRVDLSIRGATDTKGSLEHILNSDSWTEEQKQEMRKAKHFFRTIGTYHRSNHGINGISVERLVEMYGSLEEICQAIVDAGFSIDFTENATKDHIIPLDQTEFKVNFPNDNGKEIFQFWVSKNPKMWERMVLGSSKYLQNENHRIMHRHYDYDNFRAEYLEEGWFIFKINTELEGVNSIERIIYEKAKEYFEEYPNRVKDFDLLSWKTGELWVAMKPQPLKHDQEPEQLKEEHIKLFRNHLFFELNQWMPYEDPGDFLIKPKRQLTTHGYKPSAPLYAILFSNGRYFELIEDVLSQESHGRELVKIIGADRNVRRYNMKGIMFDCINVGIGSGSGHWAEITHSFGNKYFIQIGMVGSTSKHFDIGDYVISGEFARIPTQGNHIGTSLYSFGFAPLPVRISSSPILIDALMQAAYQHDIDWKMTKMATVEDIYQETNKSIGNLVKAGVTTIDQEATNIAAVLGYRSGNVPTDHPDRLHYGGFHFVSDQFVNVGGG
ncbi:MAG: hypothetical protein KJ896_04305, partial [Nanoarchaeota archaeon]|nr:hypothetical protein [Nanoarchaeota archaeon]